MPSDGQLDADRKHYYDTSTKSFVRMSTDDDDQETNQRQRLLIVKPYSIQRPSRIYKITCAPSQSSDATTAATAATTTNDAVTDIVPVGAGEDTDP
jgi:hypothetical protein